MSTIYAKDITKISSPSVSRFRALLTKTDLFLFAILTASCNTYYHISMQWLSVINFQRMANFGECCKFRWSWVYPFYQPPLASTALALNIYILKPVWQWSY